MMSGVSKFMSNFSDNLSEDVGVRSDIQRVPKGVKAKGRSRMKNAARLAINIITVDVQHREEFGDESIERLAASLKDHGQLQPIRVRWDETREAYVLVAGERRLRAMKRAGFTEADCVIAEGELTETDILTQQIIENCQREDLKPVERARAFRDLMKQQSWDQKRLANELHVSQPTISNALKLLGLDEETQDQVDSGDLTIHAAVTASRKTQRSTNPRGNTRPPKPKTFRTKAGRVVVEPKANKTYADTLREALTAVESANAGRKRAA